jgi:hypothetical protein
MLFNDQHCHKHGVTGHFNGKCSRCSGEQADLERRQHFGRLDAMTVEERLREIENTLYRWCQDPPWNIGQY